MVRKTVFIVSEDPAIRDALAKLAGSAGVDTEVFPSLDAWPETGRPEREGCLVVDAGAGSLAGPARLARFASACARMPVLVLVAPGDVPAAVNAVKMGAAYVQQKPVAEGNLLELVKRTIADVANGGATG